MLQIEVSFQDKVQKIVNSSPVPSFDEFNKLVFSAFYLEETNDLSYQYQDEEGDKIKVTSDLEFNEACRFAFRTSSSTLNLTLLDSPSLIQKKRSSNIQNVSQNQYVQNPIQPFQFNNQQTSHVQPIQPLQFAQPSQPFQFNNQPVQFAQSFQPFQPVQSVQPSQFNNQFVQPFQFNNQFVQPFQFNNQPVQPIQQKQPEQPFLSFSQMMNTQPDLVATVPQMFQILLDQGAIKVSPELQQSFKQLLASIPPEPLAEFTKSALSNSSLNQSLVSSSIRKNPVLHSATCDICKQRIIGIRFKCIYCEDFDLCENCEAKEGVHDESHMFVKITKKGPVPEIAVKSESLQNSSLTKSKILQNEGKLSSRIVKDSELSNIVVGAKFVKLWKLSNNGTVPWPKGSYMSIVEGDKHLLQENIIIPMIQPGEEIEISAEMSAPIQPGRYAAYLRLSSPSGTFFGQQMLVDVTVILPDKFQEGLQKLEEMGFANREKNKVLLEKYKGDVIAVLQEIISS